MTGSFPEPIPLPDNGGIPVDPTLPKGVRSTAHRGISDRGKRGPLSRGAPLWRIPLLPYFSRSLPISSLCFVYCTTSGASFPPPSSRRWKKGSRPRLSIWIRYFG
ncbi:hypothetical protein CHM34_15815 [Paludifilum halophilum]|uniref:Uncharacterized protein n=1 Tax=Paludifilum halophilum TaxID=1642702 RepID=A0A235B2M9_9BACL|nr:hypothetical protein CHM34_15815 [Paludifilum halophilum]